MMTTELLSSNKPYPAREGFSQLSYLLMRCRQSEFLYILTFFVSIYKQTQGLHKYAPPCLQKFDKVLFFLSFFLPLLGEKKGC